MAKYGDLDGSYLTLSDSVQLAFSCVTVQVSVEVVNSQEKLCFASLLVMFSLMISYLVARPVLGQVSGNNRVSRYHAEIRRESGAYVLTDLNSKNGTRVNGQRISRHTLTDGDRIGIKRSKFHHNDGLSLPGGAVVGQVRTSRSCHRSIGSMR